MIHSALERGFLLLMILQIGAGILIINQPDLLFEDGYNRSSPLQNNLLLIAGYLTIAELLLLMTRYIRTGSGEIILVGIMQILAAAGVKFYCAVNYILLNELAVITLLLFGTAHIGFGLFKLTVQGQVHSSSGHIR